MSKRKPLVKRILTWVRKHFSAPQQPWARAMTATSRNNGKRSLK